MRPFATCLLRRVPIATTLAVLALTAAGCGDSPTAPKAGVTTPPVEPEFVDVTVTFESVYVVEDGDGIEGAGDFVFQVIAGMGNESLDYSTSRTDLVRVNTGGTLALNKSKTFRFRPDGHFPLSYTVAATEVDQDVLGNVYADSDLNNAFKTVIVPDDARHYDIGLMKTRLGNSNCMVEFRVRITSKPVA
jgi:hypothetical protein